ncbi:hypothetical protein GW17_00059157 [Ensete ventricosum]|nr:hypothetical protein GW17_00059157 [Ensete ventricosum]
MHGKAQNDKGVNRARAYGYSLDLPKSSIKVVLKGRTQVCHKRLTAVAVATTVRASGHRVQQRSCKRRHRTPSATAPNASGRVPTADGAQNAAQSHASGRAGRSCALAIA